MVWEASVQSQVRINRVPEKVPMKVWEALAQSQVRFNGFRRRFRRRSGRLWCRGGLCSRVPEKVPEKVPGGFSAEPGQVQQARVPEKVPVKVWEALAQGQVQQGSEEGSEEGSRKPWRKAKSRRRSRRRFWNLWCRARSSSTGSAEGFQRLASQHASERFVKIKRCVC